MFFALNGPISVLFLTQIYHNGQPSGGCDRTTFDGMTNVHPPNRFAHTERLWYDDRRPHKKEKMTRTTSRHKILKEE